MRQLAGGSDRGGLAGQHARDADVAIIDTAGRLQTKKPLMVALGIASAVMFVPSMVVTTAAAPAESRGTALGAFNGFGSLGFIVGPATGGFVSQRVAETASWEAGYRAAFAVAGLLPLAVMFARIEAADVAVLSESALLGAVRGAGATLEQVLLPPRARVTVHTITTAGGG